jgi:hypothetical protein
MIAIFDMLLLANASLLERGRPAIAAPLERHSPSEPYPRLLAVASQGHIEISGRENRRQRKRRMGLIERMTPVAGLRVLISGGAAGIGEAAGVASLRLRYPNEDRKAMA